jgi:hypothetical protein
LLLYALTAIKLVAHRLLRLVSGNRRGRRVVSLSDLQAALRGA